MAARVLVTVRIRPLWIWSPVRQLDGLVGHRGHAALDQRLGQLAAGGQVEVGEQDLALAEEAVLLGHRLLDLLDEVGGAPHLLGGAGLLAARKDTRRVRPGATVGRPGRDAWSGSDVGSGCSGRAGRSSRPTGS